MKFTFNQENLLWMIGLLQPVSSSEVTLYMKAVLKNAGNLPSKETMHELCMEQVERKRVIIVHDDPVLFSLTSLGNQYLSKSRRLSRDKFRLFLLKQSRKAKLRASCEVSPELGGDAPSMDDRTWMKSCEPNKLGLSHASLAPFYWARIWQLLGDTGQLQTSHDPSRLHLLSFASEEQLSEALNKDVAELNFFETIGMMLGISPGLIIQISRNVDRHYRQFDLPKSGGGSRTISSPRIFLKVIQQFIADYLLIGLPVHHSVHSYRRKHSIVSNASIHVGKNFVGNIDISDYFGSVKAKYISNMLESNGYKADSAKILSYLCTFEDSLPQGAPTSPQLSNAFLFKFDEKMSECSDEKGISYSRYADDISLSGNDKNQIVEAIEFAKKELNISYGLKLNEDKTRIASLHGQQKVTGVVVNSAARPPRKFRRKVRAAFHNASRQETVDCETERKLSGYLNFLKNFDALKGTQEIRQLEKILQEIKKR